MKRFAVLFLALVIIGLGETLALAAGEQAMAYRKANGLVEFAPPEQMLTGYFTANEISPRFIFGPIKDLRKSLACPTAWLIEDGERQRVGDLAKRKDPFEFTVYLEADRPTGPAYYVFVVQHNQNVETWLKWRWQFHKSKAEGQYGRTRDRLSQASKDGWFPTAELRFLVTGGNLDMRNPEEVVLKDLKLAPVYDLEQSRALKK